MRLPATLTLAEARATAQQLRAADDAGEAGISPVFEVDASALSEFDTAALAVLLQARRQAQAQNRHFEVVGAPLKLVQLARLYGVADLLGLQTAA
jgi:phospholipid transport system transporter-binding protein